MEMFGERAYDSDSVLTLMTRRAHVVYLVNDTCQQLYGLHHLLELDADHWSALVETTSKFH